MSSIREDRALLRRILWPEHRTVVAGTCHDAVHRIEHGRISLILCDCGLRDGTWVDILRHAAALPDPPLLVVTSPINDARLWAEVINLGGFDLIVKPFRAREVRHVVHTAWIRKAHRTVSRCA